MGENSRILYQKKFKVWKNYPLGDSFVGSLSNHPWQRFSTLSDRKATSLSIRSSRNNCLRSHSTPMPARKMTPTHIIQCSSIYGAVAVALYVLLSILSFASLTYVAVTLSNTLFRDRKWRGVVTLVIFFGLNWLLSKVSGMLPSALNELVVVENAGAAKISAYYGLQTTPTFNDILRAMLPSAGLSLAVVVASMLGCGWMLDKKVSL